jgi:drug/metabolite transporter (DMT)-like permease
MVNLMAMTFAYKYAALAGVNQGVLLTLNSLSGVYNIFIFYFFFKERIQLIQFIGMLFMLLCVCLIGISG